MKRSVLVAALLGIAMLAALGFAANFVLGAGTHLGGATLGIAFAALAAALVVWEHDLMPSESSTQDMPSQRSSEDVRAAALSSYEQGETTLVDRRVWLVRMLAGTVGIVGAVLLFPLRSLAPKHGGSLEHTAWSGGARLVREDGTVVKAGDLAVNSVVTVFPEGHVGPHDTNAMANAATMLVRVPPEELQLPPERANWAPQGLVAYSKVCTHAGCPVALYRAKARELFCPCHQSTFDVLRGGARTFGPAARGLPQLQLAIAADGSIRAVGDFSEPVGPGYWDRA